MRCASLAWPVSAKRAVVNRIVSLRAEKSLLNKGKVLSVISRRDVLAGAGAGLMAGALAALGGTASQAGDSAEFQKLFSEIVKGAEPVAERLTLKLDDYVENGAMAFFRIDVESPMTEEDHVKSLHLLSTENPFAHVATYKFTLTSGRASVAGRMRLAKTQEVVALAQLSGDRLLIARRYVKVAIGGCGPM